MDMDIYCKSDPVWGRFYDLKDYVRSIFNIKNDADYFNLANIASNLAVSSSFAALSIDIL
jgi:hypothetical protein